MKLQIKFYDLKKKRKTLYNWKYSKCNVFILYVLKRYMYHLYIKVDKKK